MKFLNLLKNKLFLSLVAVGVAVLIILIATLSIMIPSYTSWKTYYDAAVAEREHQKYLASLPLEFHGITAELSDSVTYYDNGKASPKNDDFTVTAHFTEKGKEFTEILLGNAYEIDVPDDFAEVGGTVTVTYAYIPEADEDAEEEPEPIVDTAEVECSLSDVLPVSISLGSDPYRIAYSTEMSFDPEGCSAFVHYNDGSEEEVFADEFTANTDLLTTDTESVTVTWERSGESFSFDVRVRVSTAEDYRDGDIIALRQEGSVAIAEGAQTSTARVPIRATYSNGNRLLLRDDQVTVRGNTETASFTKKCILTVLLNNDPNVFTRAAATVQSQYEAENATLTGASSAEVDEYVKGDDGFIADGKATVVTPTNGATVSFDITCDDVAKPDFALRLALKPNESLEEGAADVLALADVMTVSVNGAPVRIPTSTVVAAVEGAGDRNVFQNVTLPKMLLMPNKTNSLVLTFTSEAAARLLIDKLCLETAYTGAFYASTEAYLVANALANDTTSEYKYEVLKEFGDVSGKPYGHAICSDGHYLYITATSWSSGPRGLVVQKYDPSTKTVIAASAEMKTTDAEGNTVGAVYESCAGITYYDEKIIVYFQTGKRMYIDVDAFAQGCTFSEYDGFNFEGLETAVLNDVYYNTIKQTFAVFSGNQIYLYDKDQKLIKSVTPEKETLGNPRRLTGSAEYIYLSYCKDGQYSPVLHAYDWNGKYIGRVVVPVPADFLKNEMGVNHLPKTNIQAVAVINGEFYVTMLRFGTENGGDCTAYFRVTMPGVAVELDPDLTFGEYVASCEELGKTPAFSAKQSVGDLGGIPSTGTYSMGGASDGRYLYVSAKIGDTTCRISKIDPENGYAVVAQSNTVTMRTGLSGDHSRMFIKDGKLYVIGYDVHSIELNKFTANCNLPKDEEMTSFLETASGYTNIKGVAWSEEQQKYAVFTTDSKLRIIDAAGNKVGEEISLSYTGMRPSSVAADGKYVYVSYFVNKQGTLPIDVFDWNGTKKTTMAIDGINLGTYQNTTDTGTTTVLYNYNVQAIYYHNGQMHASVCTWSTGGREAMFYDWTISVDFTALRA